MFGHVDSDHLRAGLGRRLSGVPVRPSPFRRDPRHSSWSLPCSGSRASRALALRLLRPGARLESGFYCFDQAHAGRFAAEIFRTRVVVGQHAAAREAPGPQGFPSARSLACSEPPVCHHEVAFVLYGKRTLATSGRPDGSPQLSPPSQPGRRPQRACKVCPGGSVRGGPKGSRLVTGSGAEIDLGVSRRPGQCHQSTPGTEIWETFWHMGYPRASRAPVRAVTHSGPFGPAIPWACLGSHP